VQNVLLQLVEKSLVLYETITVWDAIVCWRLSSSTVGTKYHDGYGRK
jgi:hypothetical protein